MADKKVEPDSDSALHLTPGTPSSPSINPSLRKARRRTLLSVGQYVEGILANDRVLLSQAITLIESTRPAHQELARQIVEACLPHAGDSIRVGITGVPGVGKSTFIEVLGSRVTAEAHRLAVLTIDPSSLQSGGSILGDKTRMPRLAADPHAFIRPSPTAGSLGGVAGTTRETMILCEAAGYDVVFVETVGVGQSEIAVHAMVDFFLLLMLAGAGDELQGIKRGIIEMADAIAITKADGENVTAAKQARGVYRNALNLFPPPSSGWRPKVLTCSAVTGDGMESIWDTIQTYVEQTQQSGYFEQHRREQARHWMHQTIEQALRSRFYADDVIRKALPAIEQNVLNGEMSS
ncbi:MAG TPA: methylmalonyl Co-A mutase-associated GTPase MeaB, partial [Rhodothermales bacterium]|nr:methylmalonyl Co-A mutase-associated GTPase MeaB [Rhodothermales bacterium]